MNTTVKAAVPGSARLYSTRTGSTRRRIIQYCCTSHIFVSKDAVQVDEPVHPQVCTYHRHRSISNFNALYIDRARWLGNGYIDVGLQQGTSPVEHV